MISTKCYSLSWTLFFSDLICEQQKDLRDRTQIARAIKTSLMSKQYGHEDFLSKLVADACGKNISFCTCWLKMLHTKILRKTQLSSK